MKERVVILEMLGVHATIPVRGPLTTLITGGLQYDHDSVSNLAVIHQSVSTQQGPQVCFIFAISISFTSRSQI